MTVWLLLTNSLIMSIAAVIFSASNREYISEAESRRWHRRWLGVVYALLLLPLQALLWCVYAFAVVGDWRFAAISVAPMIVAMFEKTLRRKTKLAVPDIEEKINERLRIGGRMYRLVKIQPEVRGPGKAIGFVDEHTFDVNRTVTRP